jgi:hypothetical protein
MIFSIKNRIKGRTKMGFGNGQYSQTIVYPQNINAVEPIKEGKKSIFIDRR